MSETNTNPEARAIIAALLAEEVGLRHDDRLSDAIEFNNPANAILQPSRPPREGMTMKIKELTFHKVSERLPEADTGDCLLLYRNEEGLTSDQFVGVMPWSDKNQYWLDILASPDAGAMWSPKDADVLKYGMWAKWEEVSP